MRVFENLCPSQLTFPASMIDKLLESIQNSPTLDGMAQQIKQPIIWLPSLGWDDPADKTTCHLAY